MHKRRDGFTFIELLVAVTIIAILSVVGLVSFQAASRKARDAKRKADIEQIRSALEICRTETGSYPAALGTAIVCGTNTYLNPVPSDPRQGQTGYEYTYSATATTYTLRVLIMEDPTECPTGSTNPCIWTNP